MSALGSRILVTAVGVSLLVAPPPAAAGPSAKSLQGQCMSKPVSVGDGQQQALSGVETSFKRGYCDGYVAGFMDSNARIRDGVSVKQIEDAFLQYLEAHPAESDSPASFVLESSSRAAGLTYKK
jgi:hypothetical protein